MSVDSEELSEYVSFVLTVGESRLTLFFPDGPTSPALLTLFFPDFFLPVAFLTPSSLGTGLTPPSLDTAEVAPPLPAALLATILRVTLVGAFSLTFTAALATLSFLLLPG